MSTAIRLRDLGHGRQDAVKLDPRDIRIEKGFNYRDINSEAAQAHIDWLEKSIRENGVQEPIRVRYDNGVITLVNGECRLIAAKRLRSKGVDLFIPAIVTKGDEAEILATSIIANGALPPTQLEFGEAAKRLLKYGWSIERIAKYAPPHLKLSEAQRKRWVKDAVDLHDAPLAVKKAVREGIDGVKVTPARALAAARKNPMHAEEQLAQEAQKAKETGKTVIRRKKGAGKAARAKEAAKSVTDRLLSIGDQMAGEVTARPALYTAALVGSAKAWQQLRGN